MILLLLSGIGIALYLLIGLLLLSWIDYDYELFHFIAECPVPTLELVLLLGWPVLLSDYCWRRRAKSRIGSPERSGRIPPTEGSRHLRPFPIGTKCHQPSPSSTGRYSVEHPHQSGI